ncbi:mediator of RNA polymerase II transcription subunit 25-like [Vigna radiata var. radiata]|uniref:Mediator of RNA polymerase II transcription subunit 25-like n=1 Tax=Vigna radiata var. radiata TaxID=3916 RepID=A0A3Q0EPM0_VIGRR|nr:mediator of RNA polymerase II transcription subunit 25-like [Vigna radiata var. radiata]
MANNKWLNITVDGNSALASYWPSIFSDCLQKIVRNFFEDSRNEGANAQVGLVMYNANNNPGILFHLPFIFIFSLCKIRLVELNQ